jgi:ribosomal protein S18 acetylase RimI-like enzyme
MPSIRSAAPRDAAALALLAEHTFRTAFSAQNTPDNFETYCRATFGEALQAREIADPRVETLLCHAGEVLVGYGQLRWGPAPACVSAARPAEIQRLYVDRPWHGKGVARDLMAALLARAAAGGADLVWLGVWEHNPRAIAFYRKCGFAEVGEHVFHLGRDAQRDLVLARPPTDAQPIPPR